MDKESLHKILLQVSEPHEVSNVWKRSYTEAGVFSYGEEDVMRVSKAVKILLGDNNIRYSFSSKDLEEKIFRLTEKTLNVGNVEKEEIIQSWIDEFEAEINKKVDNFEVVIPIENFKITSNLDVGDVEFFVFDKTYCSKWFPDSTTEDDKKLEKNKKPPDIIENQLMNRTCGSVRIKGSPEYVIEAGRNKISLALNILRLFTYVRGDDFYRRYFGLKETLTCNGVDGVYLVTDKGLKVESHYRTGFLFPFEVDDNRKMYMEHTGFGVICNILKKPKLTDLEERLLTSIFWFGQAMSVQCIKERKNDLKSDKFYELASYSFEADRFIKIITSLESLFLRGEEPKRNTLSERMALLLADDLRSRLLIYEMMKEIYEHRSRIVHGGDTFMSTMELDSLAGLAQAAIFRVLEKIKTKELKTLTDLYTFFEVQKFK
ncbi:Uncharacterised protein [uncultured archaeon]|nr:Uncharacterised protein [uncultured archaeon]